MVVGFKRTVILEKGSKSGPKTYAPKPYKMCTWRRGPKGNVKFVFRVGVRRGIPRPTHRAKLRRPSWRPKLSRLGKGMRLIFGLLKGGFKEQEHPRAPKGAKGKHSGGRFVPKQSRPAGSKEAPTQATLFSKQPAEEEKPTSVDDRLVSLFPKLEGKKISNWVTDQSKPLAQHIKDEFFSGMTSKDEIWQQTAVTFWAAMQVAGEGAPQAVTLPSGKTITLDGKDYWHVRSQLRGMPKHVCEPVAYLAASLSKELTGKFASHMGMGPFVDKIDLRARRRGRKESRTKTKFMAEQGKAIVELKDKYGIEYDTTSYRAAKEGELDQLVDAIDDMATLHGIPSTGGRSGKTLQLGIVGKSKLKGYAAHYVPTLVTIELGAEYGQSFPHEFAHYLFHEFVGSRPDAIDEVRELVGLLQNSPEATAIKESGRFRKVEYWLDGQEMMCRLYECWVSDQLEAKNPKSVLGESLRKKIGQSRETMTAIEEPATYSTNQVPFARKRESMSKYIDGLIRKKFPEEIKEIEAEHGEQASLGWIYSNDPGEIGQYVRKLYGRYEVVRRLYGVTMGDAQTLRGFKRHADLSDSEWADLLGKMKTEAPRAYGSLTQKERWTAYYSPATRKAAYPILEKLLKALDVRKAFRIFFSLSKAFREQEHPRAPKGTSGKYSGGRFVPKGGAQKEKEAKQRKPARAETEAKIRKTGYFVSNVKLHDPGDAAVLLERIADSDREKVAVIHLDGNTVTGFEIVSIGGLGATMQEPRETLKAATLRGTKRIVVAHNHPSGALEPSANDSRALMGLIDAAGTLGIDVVDYLIVGDTAKGVFYYSLALANWRRGEGGRELTGWELPPEDREPVSGRIPLLEVRKPKPDPRVAGTKVTGASDAAELFSHVHAKNGHRAYYIAALDTSAHPIAVEMLAVDEWNGLDPNEVARFLVAHSAAGFIIGQVRADKKPSPPELLLPTEQEKGFFTRLKAAVKEFRMDFLDVVTVVGERHSSLADTGWLSKAFRLAFKLTKAFIKTPTTAHGSVDWEKIPVGASVWITVSKEDSPLHGKPILLTKRPDHLMAMTGRAGSKHFKPQAYRHLTVQTSTRAKQAKADIKRQRQRKELKGGEKR